MLLNSNIAKGRESIGHCNNLHFGIHTLYKTVHLVTLE